jgi:hypothetical protein
LERATLLFRRFAYALTALFFLALLMRFYSGETGFTSLIAFGEYNEQQFIPELKKLDYHVEERSWGYDAQWYVQLAVRPTLDGSEIATAIDNLPYRARRILFCWTAHALGCGQPAWVVQIYALQNVVCWLLLAWLLLHWFRPLDLNNLFRWWGVMFSFGLLVSVRNSLVDGPSLLLVVIGVRLVECGRPWLSALAMGIGGLGKETTIFAATALIRPDARTWKSWAAMIATGLLVALPLALWTLVVVFMLGPVGTDTGSRAFGLPFVELAKKIGVTAQELGRDPANWDYLSSAVMLISVITQFLLIAVRPLWKSPWWRVGAAYAALMIVLGEAVWEGYPGATSRVLLPMLVAFNVVVPKGRWWWIVLVLGNLSVVTSPSLLNFGGRGYMLGGPSALASSPSTGEPLRVRFDEGWFPAEKTIWDYWRWSDGRGAIRVQNPHTQNLVATLEFKMSSRSASEMALEVNGVERWRARTDQARRPAAVQVVLPPGETVLRFIMRGPLEPGEAQAQTRGPFFRLVDFRIVADELRK